MKVKNHSFKKSVYFLIILIIVCLLSIIFTNLYVNSNKILYGKKITLIGDSITEKNYKAMTNWADYLHIFTGAKIQNLGISSTNFQGSRDNGLNPYHERIELIDKDTDLIGVAISFNNLDSIPLGNELDTLDSNTICGYANYFFDELIRQFPNTPIICYCQSVWGDKYPGIKESDEYLNVMSIICLNHKIPFNSEMYSTEYLSPLNEDYFTPDNYFNMSFYYMFFENHDSFIDTTHPNSKGHKIIANHLITFFLENIT